MEIYKDIQQGFKECDSTIDSKNKFIQAQHKLLVIKDEQIALKDTLIESKDHVIEAQRKNFKDLEKASKPKFILFRKELWIGLGVGFITGFVIEKLDK